MNRCERRQCEHAHFGDKLYFRLARHVVGNDDSNDATERRSHDTAYSRT